MSKRSKPSSSVSECPYASFVLFVFDVIVMNKAKRKREREKRRRRRRRDR
jgi:hypothetical protein